MIDNLIIIRGSGDIASGSIHRLIKCGFPVLALETQRPSSIRRHIAFSEAVYDGSATVEDVTAELVKNVDEALACMRRGNPAVMIDPKAEVLSKLRPLAVVDAILAGNDLLIVTDYEEAIKTIKQALEDKTLSEDLLDKMVFRLLAFKYYKGLLVPVSK